MSDLRQDAWTEAEDRLLAEIVLKHIREGSTQLAAFQEVSERLSRTPAACGFRWNATVRKKHEKAIQLAKEDRIPVKEKQSSLSQAERPHISSLTLHDVIEFLKSLEINARSTYELEEENKNLRRDLETIRKQYSEKLNNLMVMNEMLNKDYKTLIETIETAKKWVDANEADVLENK